jgi:multicomponent Na+:H+ antiporter subunit G
MTEWITAALLLLGVTFMSLAAVGILRMPDLLTRLQTATKATTLGIGCMFVAVAVHFAEFGVVFRSLLIIAFFFLTNPVAGHMIARAAYFAGVPLWKGSHVDELDGRYDPQTHYLRSGDSRDAPAPHDRA